MLYTVENEQVRITVREHGAELRSITEKADGTEYLWNGDPVWWKYSSPVLFPIVGKLVDGKYRVDGKEYALPALGWDVYRILRSLSRRCSRLFLPLTGRWNRCNVIRINSGWRFPIPCVAGKLS